MVRSIPSSRLLPVGVVMLLALGIFPLAAPFHPTVSGPLTAGGTSQGSVPWRLGRALPPDLGGRSTES